MVAEAHRARRGRYTLLLALLIVLLTVIPAFEAYEGALIALDLALSVILIVAIYVSSERRRDLVIASALMLPSVVGRFLPWYPHSHLLLLAVSALTAAFLAYAAVTIVTQVVKAQRVTFDTISGAICGYLLIGLTWAFVYVVIGLLLPGSFNIGSVRGTETALPGVRVQLLRLMYYSFTTLTTTGYGDVTPLSAPARSFAVLEAIVGQFYVAVLVATLVSLQILHSRRDDTC